MKARLASWIKMSARDLSDLQAWVDDIGSDRGTALTLINRLAARLRSSDLSPADEQVAGCIASAWRHHVRAVEATLSSLTAVSFPLPPKQAERLESLVDQVAIACQHFERMYTVTGGDDPLGAMRPPKGFASRWAGYWPLACSLALRTRLTTGLLCQRVVIDDGQLQGLVRLTALLRRAKRLDLPMPDDIDGQRGPNVQASIASVLLLAAAQPDRLDPYELGLVNRLAREWSDCCRWRLDDDAVTRLNQRGPTMVLSASLTARLDTRRIDRRLQERIAILSEARDSNAVRLPKGLSRRRCLQLLVQLRDDWSVRHRNYLWHDELAHEVSIRRDVLASLSIGDRFDGDGTISAVAVLTPDAHSPLAAIAAVPTPSAPMPALRHYVFGQHSRDTIVRRVLVRQTHIPRTMAEWLENGESATLYGIQDKQLNLQCQHSRQTPLGSLVAVALPRVDNAAPTRDTAVVVRLGRVTRRCQGLAIGANQRTQWLALTTWPMPAELVSIQRHGQINAEDVVLLVGVEGVPASILVQPGLFVAGQAAKLRMNDEQLAIVIGAVIERGASFERLAVERSNSARTVDRAADLS